MHSAVERIAAFAAAARPEHLTNDTRRLFKRNILDSLGCAIAALPGQPFQALREQFDEYRAPGRCTLIGPSTLISTECSFVAIYYLPSVALDQRILAASAVLKSPFIDLQGFDPVLKSRGRHGKLDRSS